MKTTEIMSPKEGMGLTVWKRKLVDTLKSENFVKNFPSKEYFLETLTGDKELEIAKDERKCIFGDYPTLWQVNALFHEDDLSEQWISGLLADLDKYFSFGKNLKSYQITQLAEHISSKYSHLKISEVMLFFRKCKEIEFGEFYGQIDPQRILIFLIDFLEDRKQKIDEAMAEIELKYEEWHRQNVVAGRSLDSELMKFRKEKENAPIKTLPTESKKEIKIKSALTLVNNVHGYDDAQLEKMCACWVRKYGLTPQEYVKKN